ncbi:hypothetical protein VTK56DRAFT_7110 [Thermocarpiscus australiensis]
MTAITVPDKYGYVLLAATSTFFVNVLHVTVTSRRRKAAGIKYPIPYATQEQADKDPKAFAFNCAQRAHANFTENLTPFLGALLISGLRYPEYAATLGAAWSASRVFYVLGYTNNGPQGRLLGSIVSSASALLLNLMAAYASLGFVLGW